MTNNKKAEQLGRTAYHNGKMRVPYHDNDMMNMLVGGQIGDGIAPMTAWLYGWDDENLKAPY